jgi:peroxiredoxin
VKPDTTLPPWTLRDGTGAKHALPDLITQTTVFVFFLGHECAHCMNQLNTFAPMAGKLRAAGAQIIAISADDPAGVAETFAGPEPGKDPQPFPFLILADNEKQAFRSWGVHDQFFDSPIHGVFIVDGAGRLRWRHLGAEPFTHVSEVLAACEAIQTE